MEERERIVRLWLDCWLQRKDLGIATIFAPDAVYIESWGPIYRGAVQIKHWFEEWNTRGVVNEWKIEGFFHKDRQTVVTWYFANQMKDGRREVFDGVSVVEWTEDGKIALLKEYGCNLDRYDPYEGGDTPQFREEKAHWF